MKYGKCFSKYWKLTLVVLCLALMQGCDTDFKSEVFSGDEGVKPYTHLNFQNNPNNFQFAVIGDHSGGHRPGVLSAGVDLLNLLQPEFVVNVGDLIEGYVEDERVLKSQWAEADKRLKRLDMPFFSVPGNHDVNFDPSEQVWFDRVAANRSYSHFVYKDALFLLISTEDPPKKDPGKELSDKYEQLKIGKITKPEEVKSTMMELEEWAGQVNISEAQVEYFQKVLANNNKVRWTFVFMHSPPWAHTNLGNFAKIESLLADRSYTMFAGHTHTYNYTRRNGRDYITMAMTGAGVPGSLVGHMDHVTWVSMTDKEPVISNLLLNGILNKRGAVPTLQNFLLYRPRQITQTGQSLGAKSIPNLRDLGGYQTEDGATIVAGLIYRSNQLSDIKPDDMQMLAELKLKNAFDLRTKAERDKRPEELPPGVNYVVVDVLADSPQAGPAQLEKLMADPKVANTELGSGKVEAGFKASYREFVTLPSAQREFRKMFLAFGDKQQLPALFHCTTGKDRTGWAAAAFLTLMGVPKDKVYEDYLRSNDYILTAYKKHIDAFVAAGGDAKIPKAILGVKKEYLDAAFDEMQTKYGSIEKYFADGLGINTVQQQALRDLYLH